MASIESKIKALDDLRTDGTPEGWKNIALCFGHFNVIHPGHIRYFQTAKEYGTRLVVTVESDKVLSSHRSSIRFSAVERATSVAAIDVVDNVVIVENGDLEDVVALIAPEALVLGKEFESLHVSPVSRAIEVAEQNGVKIVFAAGEAQYATAALFDSSQAELEVRRWRQFESVMNSHGIDLRALLSRMNELPKPKVLVLGDTIVDRYVACDPIGLSNEAPVVVVKEMQSRDYIGGAAIVAAHVVSLGGTCTYLSVVGSDEPASYVDKELAAFGVKSNLIQDDTRPTTFKLRYLVENQKLFRVSRLKDHNVSKVVEKQLIDRIWQIAPELSGVVVSDFVYGVITPRILEVLSQVAEKYNILLFGDLQCSSQIGNVGKFRNFDLLSPTEREVRIALNNQGDGIEHIANRLIQETMASRLVVKLGGDGLIAYDTTNSLDLIDREHFPALSANPVDVAGAGDSLLATLAVGLSRGFSLMESTAMGCCASAIAVQTIGNIPVRLNMLTEFIHTRSRTANA